MHSVREELSITNWGFAQISLMACQSNNKVWHTNQSSLAVVSVPLCTIAVRLNFHGPTQQTFNYGHATQNGANNFLKEFCKIFIPPRRSSLSWIWRCRPSFYPPWVSSTNRLMIQVGCWLGLWVLKTLCFYFWVPKNQCRISALEVYYFKVNTKRESNFFLQEDRLSFVLTLK